MATTTHLAQVGKQNPPKKPTENAKEANRKQQTKSESITMVTGHKHLCFFCKHPLKYQPFLASVRVFSPSLKIGVSGKRPILDPCGRCCHKVYLLHRCSLVGIFVQGNTPIEHTAKHCPLLITYISMGPLADKQEFILIPFHAVHTSIRVFIFHLFIFLCVYMNSDHIRQAHTWDTTMSLVKSN